MSGNLKKDDLRTIKTCKALLSSLIKLLKKRSFSRLTVNDLCEEAQISRPTFYSHFKDKYDLLDYMLSQSRLEIVNSIGNYKEMEHQINKLIKENKKLITNLLQDANNETMDILRKFMVSLLELSAKCCVDRQSPEYIILTNFCAGGMLNFLSWQISNKFPANLKVMNPYIYRLLNHILEYSFDESLEYRGILLYDYEDAGAIGGYIKKQQPYI